MKKISFVFVLFSLLLWQACSQKEVSPQPRTFWEYSGTSTMTNRAISDLKNVGLEDKINGQPLWKDGKAIVFDGQTTPVLVIPIKSEEKDKIANILVVSYENDKMTYKVIAPKDRETPYMQHASWKGYFNALDKELFKTANKSEGFKKAAVIKKPVFLSGRVQDICSYEECITIEWEDDGVYYSYTECWGVVYEC